MVGCARFERKLNTSLKELKLLGLIRISMYVSLRLMVINTMLVYLFADPDLGVQICFVKEGGTK